MLILLLKMFKKIFLQLVILQRECKQTLIIMWQRIGSIMQALGKKFDPTSKNIIKRQNPLELFLKIFQHFMPKIHLLALLLKELNVWKKDIASELTKNAPRPPGVDFAIKDILNKLKDRPEPKHNNNNFSPPPSLSPPPRPPSFFHNDHHQDHHQYLHL